MLLHPRWTQISPFTSRKSCLAVTAALAAICVRVFSLGVFEPLSSNF